DEPEVDQRLRWPRAELLERHFGLRRPALGEIEHRQVVLEVALTGIVADERRRLLGILERSHRRHGIAARVLLGHQLQGCGERQLLETLRQLTTGAGLRARKGSQRVVQPLRRALPVARVGDPVLEPELVEGRLELAATAPLRILELRHRLARAAYAEIAER